ncbi:MAG: hypothetical protein C0454_16710, partial [Parvibaculum sp.]|nr:hypothetical protein [Parvibaculum sp.]
DFRVASGVGVRLAQMGGIWPPRSGDARVGRGWVGVGQVKRPMSAFGWLAVWLLWGREFSERT